MQKKLMQTLDFSDANRFLPTAHDYDVEDELYIINLICLQEALERLTELREKSLEESIKILKRDILIHEKIIWARNQRKKPSFQGVFLCLK